MNMYVSMKLKKKHKKEDTLEEIRFKLDISPNASESLYKLLLDSGVLLKLTVYRCQWIMSTHAVSTHISLRSSSLIFERLNNLVDLTELEEQ